MTLLISCLLMFSCENNNVEVEFIEIKNDIARFDIVNNSNKDIRKISFEIRFLDNSNKLLLIDTLVYQMSKEYQKVNIPFLKANEKTFVAQGIPNNCKRADIKVLKIENIKGD